jgi:ABC-type amino acid transport system permease subunit
MTPRISADFVPQFLAGMAVNFEIAAIALVAGLARGSRAAFRAASPRP